jgi:hypothetical protein
MKNPIQISAAILLAVVSSTAAEKPNVIIMASSLIPRCGL